MAFNYSKLLGLIRERKITQEKLAEEIGTKPTTLSLKLNNKAKFKQTEILRICSVLGIEACDIGTYFFAPKV